MGFFTKTKKLNKDQVGRYIFAHLDIPVLVLDEDKNVVIMNSEAEQFFQLKEEETYHFSQLFEITKEDVDVLFDSIKVDVQSAISQLATRGNGAICKIRVDVPQEENLDGYYVVYIHDMTEDYNTIENLKNVKSALEEKLQEKNKQIEAVTLQAITTIANFIDSKEEYNSGHSARVAAYSEAIASEMGWSSAECLNIHYVALLHDIGKIGVPTRVLNKRSNLNKQEQELIKQHTTIGEDILKDITTVENVSLGALYHHEHFDGSGYPKGIVGEEIPLIARIIAVADAYDAMSSDRKYRENISDEEIRIEIEKNAGTQFDPYISSVVVRMIDEGIFEKIRQKMANATKKDIISESSALMVKYMGNELSETKEEAEKDYLTGIWNRRNGERHVMEYLKLGDGALVIIDLDNFKMVNDTYGHLMGDHVLKQVADVIKSQGKNEFVCRLGGDEFLMFVRDVVTIEETQPTIDAIMFAFNSRCEKDEILAQTSLSIGISLSSQDGRDYHQLFRCADRALYFVKQNGKGGYSFHNRAENDGGNNTKLELERLVDALKHKDSYRGAFRVEYQRFLQFHEFVEKFTKRNHQSVQLVLLTIDFDHSAPVDIDERDVIMRDLENSVSTALRSVDLSTRFSSAQMLVVLVDATQGNVPLTVQRMLSQFYMIYRPQDIKVSFDTADITMY